MLKDKIMVVVAINYLVMVRRFYKKHNSHLFFLGKLGS